VASAWELLTGRDTDKFLRFFVKMLVLCNLCGVKPIIVFDGASLPAKAKEEAERRQRRTESSQKAKEEIESRQLTSFGQVDSKLRSMIVQSVSISAEMITRTMSVLRRLNVDFVVAPYEADAQLAFMYRQGIVSGVVSEDSDLIAFGCHRLLSKMDMNGDFVDVRLDWAFRGPDMPNKPINAGEIGKLERWTESMFVDLCIMSGSDYKLGKIAGIGIKKAFQLLNRLGNLPRIVDEIAKSKGWKQSDKETFLSEFNRAKTAFQSHRVFDIKTVKCVTVTDNHIKLADTDHSDIIGPEIDDSLTRQIMCGEIDAKTHEKRYFLDRLPPGVLGVYNSSLKPKAADPELPSVDQIPISQMEQLELQVVAEFQRVKDNQQPGARELNRRTYLNKLEGLILQPPAGPLVIEDDDFGDLEALLDLDTELDSNVIDLDDDEVEAPAQEVPVAAPKEASKVKNPFAVQRTGENKKPRQSIVETASVLPHLATCKPPRQSLDGIRTVTDVFEQNRRLSLQEPPAKQQMVTVRNLPQKVEENKFKFRR
jgi:5'-3' exonuclease